MKKTLLSLFILLFLVSNCLASPNNTMSLQYSPNPNEAINSSNYKTQENHQINTYNTHGHTDIIALGSVTTGTWIASKITAAYGGTGQDFSATAQGNIIYFSGAGAMAALGPGTSGQFLKTNGASANPAWATLSTTQSSQAVGTTSSPTTTSTSYVNLEEMTVTITTGANPVFIAFVGSIRGTDGDDISIALDIDGTDVAERVIAPPANKYASASLVWLHTATAASHTFKIQWKVTSGTGTAWSIGRSLVVIELKS